MARKSRKKGFLPGMAPPTYKDLDGAIEEYVKVRNKRMKMTVEEKEKHEIALDLMHRYKLNSYEHNGWTASIANSEKLKVKTGGEEDELDDIDPEAELEIKKTAEAMKP
jgi:hypothetical protein